MAYGQVFCSQLLFRADGSSKFGKNNKWGYFLLFLPHGVWEKKNLLRFEYFFRFKSSFRLWYGW